MSDSGVSYWDTFYLSNFTVTAGTQTISELSTLATLGIGSSVTDQLLSDGGEGPENLSTGGAAGTLMFNSYDTGTTLNDTVDPTSHYIGQAVINVDPGTGVGGSSTVTAIFAESNIGGQNVVIMYVPNLGYTGPMFSSSADFISLNPNITLNTNNFVMPCFLTGTMIATPDGERAVETLSQGDLVLTAEGAAKAIRWLGRSTLASRFADPVRDLPVRIKAGALGENQPARDLLVSPGHAMLIDGVLVHAGALVNGTSIVRETGIKGRFTYFHVETDGHDVLLAEGAATESFLLGGEDMKFDNWDERPESAPPAELAYPRVKAPRQMPRSVRELLESRAAAITEPVAVAA